MVAGASRIIVSLWEVNALATAFLMIKFYEILKDYVQIESADVAKVLNQAQKWLMGLSHTEAEQELEKLKPYIDQTQIAEKKPRIAQAYVNQYRKTCSQSLNPFASPKYWAAFTTIGL
jgi:CHAT domain-containing protein